VLKYKQEDISVPGAKLRLRIAQTEGIPMVLVHGGPGGTDYLSKFLGEQIAKAGYQPIGWIQRGSPGSPSKGPFTVDQFVEDLESVRKYLNVDQFAIYGHSWGGFLATCYASRYAKHIERLILTCPMGIRLGWKEDFQQKLVDRIPEDQIDRYHELFEQAENATTKEERNQLMFERAQIHVYSYYSPKHREGQPGLAHLDWEIHETLHNSATEWLSNSDWEEGVQELDCPASLIYGEDDPIPQESARDYHEIIPNLHITPLEECGHFPFFEIPKIYSEALEEALRVS